MVLALAALMATTSYRSRGFSDGRTCGLAGEPAGLEPDRACAAGVGDGGYGLVRAVFFVGPFHGSPSSLAGPAGRWSVLSRSLRGLSALAGEPGGHHRGPTP